MSGKTFSKSEPMSWESRALQPLVVKICSTKTNRKKRKKQTNIYITFFREHFFSVTQIHTCKKMSSEFVIFLIELFFFLTLFRAFFFSHNFTDGKKERNLEALVWQNFFLQPPTSSQVLHSGEETV